VAQGFGLGDVLRLRWPAAAHEQVEGKGSREDVVIVELRRRHDPPPPARGPQGLVVKPSQEDEAGFRLAQSREQSRQGRLAAP
jgi:hypothetical protein